MDQLKTTKVHKIPVEAIVAAKKKTARVLQGLTNLPNIIIPPELSRDPDQDPSKILCDEVRAIFNTVSRPNLENCKQKIRREIMDRMENLKMMQDVVQIMLASCMINSKWLDLCLELINSVWDLSAHESSEESVTLGSLFLKGLRSNLLDYIEEKKLESMTQLHNCIDEKSQNKYNEEKNKIHNIVRLMVLLYQEKDRKKLHLSIQEILSLVQLLLQKYNFWRSQAHDYHDFENLENPKKKVYSVLIAMIILYFIEEKDLFKESALQELLPEISRIAREIPDAHTHERFVQVLKNYNLQYTR
jgi:hypothetical protein